MRHSLIIRSLLALFSTPLFAVDLCDAECSVLIEFPEGGSLHAVEELTITFGDNALIDTVGTQTAYVKDNTLTLNAGESIVFGAGGSFDIGDAGNIAYTNLEITTSGTIDLIAVDGSEAINIAIIKITGAATFNITAKTISFDELNMEDENATLNIHASDDNENDPCSIQSNDGQSDVGISIGGDTPVLIGTSESCDSIIGVISIGVISLPDGFVLPITDGDDLFSDIEIPESTNKNNSDNSDHGSISLWYLFFLSGFAAFFALRNSSIIKR